MLKQRILVASIATLAAYQSADAEDAGRNHARRLAEPGARSDYARVLDRRDPTPSLNPGPMDAVFLPAAEARFLPQLPMAPSPSPSEWDEWKSVRDV